MEKGIAVTGMGIVSALGTGKDDNYHALTAGRSGLSYPGILHTRHNHLPVGEIKTTNGDLAEKLKLGNGQTFTRGALLGAIAAGEALHQANLKLTDLASTGFISATSVGGMDYTERYFDSFGKDESSHAFIRAQHPGYTTSLIAEYFGLGGFTTTISTACSSSANSIMLGARMIKAGKLKRVVVGGTDCLSKFTLNGFNSLMILSSEFCKPFDHDREGLNLGEGAAYLVLESEEVVKDKKVLGRVVGYGNANDAFHQTASSEDGKGAFLAMQRALEVAGLSPENIDYINAHGTATKNNDLAESRALKRLFRDKVPAFNSTKGATGHTLAAAGAVESVFSILALEQGEIFPGLHFNDPMEETGLHPSVKKESRELKYILTNSFGFGGNCSSLIFSKNEG